MAIAETRRLLGLLVGCGVCAATCFRLLAWEGVPSSLLPFSSPDGLQCLKACALCCVVSLALDLNEFGAVLFEGLVVEDDLEVGFLGIGGISSGVRSNLLTRVCSDDCRPPGSCVAEYGPRLALTPGEFLSLSGDGVELLSPTSFHLADRGEGA